MATKLQALQQEYFQLLEDISYVKEDLDYSILDTHIPHLESLDRIGKSAVSVFDMYQKTHIYISPLYRQKLGLPSDQHEGPEGFDKLMHPNDVLTSIEAGLYFLRRAMNMPPDKLRNMRLVNDYRIRGSEKNWIRMTETFQILELDPNGNIWLSLSVVDVSTNQNVNEPMSSRWVNQKTGEVFPFTKHNNKVVPEITLSTREKEILLLIADGYVSKQIADELHISIHTVNTHRQNIICKMDVVNTAEAIRLGTKMGILE